MFRSVFATLNGYFINYYYKWPQNLKLFFIIITTSRHFTYVCCHLAQTFPSTCLLKTNAYCCNNFTFTITLTRLWISYFLNALLIVDLNGRRRNYDCVGLSNYLWLFTCRCCRCDNYETFIFKINLNTEDVTKTYIPTNALVVQHTSPHRTPCTHTKRYAAASPQLNFYNFKNL